MTARHHGAIHRCYDAGALQLAPVIVQFTFLTVAIGPGNLQFFCCCPCQHQGETGLVRLNIGLLVDCGRLGPEQFGA